MRRLLALLLMGMTTAVCPMFVSHAQEGFTDHGVGAEVAELRGLVPTVTEDGRTLLICSATDEGPIGYLLVTDLATGETVQHFCPEDVRQYDPFGALLHTNGNYYHTQGRVLLEFDPQAGQFTFHGQPSGTTSVYLCFTEAPDGTIWAGGTYNCGLISMNPETKELTDHGRMDPEEIYLSYLGVDNSGWVYCGIGTARQNIVAYNPETGERRGLVAEEDRVHGTAMVYPGADGAVYGQVNNKWLRLTDGVAEPIEQRRPRRDVVDLRYGSVYRDLPDGRRISRYSLADRVMTLSDPKTGESVDYSFEYRSGGAMITSLGEGPEGVVYGSTAHPMNLLAFDTRTRTLTDMGHIPQVGGGNFCAITHLRGQVIGAQYSAGRLWAYDPAEPWNPGGGVDTFGLDANRLIEVGEAVGGHFTYLEGHRIAFFHGNHWGAEANFTLSVEAAGDYYLYLWPYRHTNYCTVQFSLNGEPLGEPYRAASETTKPGNVLEFGPMTLQAGEHKLSALTIEMEGQQPFFGLLCAELTTDKRQPQATSAQNPRVLAGWKRDITRPRTALAHPDGKHVMMAGFAAYGLAGGGIGIYNLETGQETLLTAEDDLLPSHSCITLDALPNGDLVGGTSISAPGGGHSTATEAELFIIDWPTKRLVFRTVPVPGDTNIVSIGVAENGLVYGLSGKSTFFVFDPASRQVVHSESLGDYGRVPRHALHWGPDGNLYAIMSKAILRITPGTFEHEKLADAPEDISAGGALVNGLLVFACNASVWSYEVSGL